MNGAAEQHGNSKVPGRPFVPGDPRINRKGRPPGTSLTDRLRKILDEDDDGVPVAQRLMEAGVEAARRGDFRFWQEILNRIDGKVPDRLAADVDGISVVFRMADGTEVELEQLTDQRLVGSS